MLERNYSFYHIVVVLPLRNVPKTVIWVNQNGGAQAVVRGGHGSPGPPIATALGKSAISRQNLYYHK